jgi:hypothetical protein
MLGVSNVRYTAGALKGGKAASLPNCYLAAAITHWCQIFDFASHDTWLLFL